MARYEIDGIQYPGVTQINGQLDKSTPLMAWAVKMVTQYIRDNAKTESGVYLVGEELLNDAQYNYRAVSDQAKDIGTQTHDLISHYVKTKGDKSKSKEYPDEVQNAFLAFLEWEKQHKVKWLESEMEVCSRKHGYAGRFDFIAEIDGDIYLGDFKTSKAIYDTDPMQVAAYLWAWNEMNSKGDHVEHGCILRLDKATGLPEFHPIDDKKLVSQYEAFIKLLDFYYTFKKRRLKGNPFTIGD